MKLLRMWEDWKAWRACRKAHLTIEIPKPEPKLNVFETFLHLGMAGRIGLILSALFVYFLAIGGTFSANVMPYAETFFRELFRDGRFNSNAFTSMLGLAGSVLWLSASVFCFRMADSWLSKIIILIASIGLALVNVTNNCETQKETQVAHYDGPKQKQARIKQSQEDMDRAKAALNALTKHERVSKESVAEARAELASIKASAESECHRGVNGNARGPKCEAREAERKEQAKLVDKLQRDKDLTDEEDGLRAAYDTAKAKHDAEGVTPEDVGEQASAFWAFFVHIHAMDKDVALALTKDAPTIHGITQELLAWGFTPVGLKIVFWLFGLCVSTKTEARDRMLKHLEKMSEAEVKTALSDASPALARNHVAPVMEPDHSEESVLKIEGKELPEFVHAPEGDAEHIAAGALKAAPEYAFGRKARRPQPSNKDSARLYIKENTVPREGRFIWASDAIAGYEAMCKEMNLEPISGNAFGRMMNSGEFPHIRVERLSSGRTKYWGIGLRNNFKVVAA